MKTIIIILTIISLITIITFLYCSLIIASSIDYHDKK